MEVFYAWRPSGWSTDQSSIIVSEMRDLNLDGYNDAVSSMIGMIEDLRQHGRASRYATKLGKSPLWELKTTTRGGPRGGARVYLWLMEDDSAAIVNCEVKAPDEPTSQHKLEVALERRVAHRAWLRTRSGDPVLRPHPTV